MTADFSDLLPIAVAFGAAAAAVTPMAEATVAHNANDLLSTAVDLAPELTGELRASGHVVIEGLNADVVFDSDHSIYVEYGTNDTPPQPYLNPAFDLQEQTFGDDLERDAGDLF
jgi:hypothetical protein